MEAPSEVSLKTSPQNEQTLCVACKHEIPPFASVCPICKSYQAKWKNHLQYIAGITTLVVLILSGSVWLVAKVQGIFFYREDVRLVKCNTRNSAVIVNKSDGEVFLSQLLLWMRGRTSNWVAPGMKINEKVGPGQFFTKKFENPRINEGAFVRGQNQDDFEKLLVRAVHSDPCFEMVFFTESDSDLQDLRTIAGPTLNTFEVAGYLEYWSSRSDSIIRVPLSGTGAVQQNIQEQCKNLQ